MPWSLHCIFWNVSLHVVCYVLFSICMEDTVICGTYKCLDLSAGLRSPILFFTVHSVLLDVEETNNAQLIVLPTLAVLTLQCNGTCTVHITFFNYSIIPLILLYPDLHSPDIPSHPNFRRKMKNCASLSNSMKNNWQASTRSMKFTSRR